MAHLGYTQLCIRSLVPQMSLCDRQVLKTSGATLYRSVARDIRSRIEQGEWRPGSRLPAMADLGEQYGVSNITIRGAITSLAREGLVVREERRGIFVADKAVRKKTRTGILGCYGLDAATRHFSYYLRLFSGVQSAARRHGYELLILDGNMSSVSWEKIDGFISAATPGDGVLDSLPTGLPAVTLLHRVDGIASVVADDYNGMRRAVDHLWSCGHRHIAYLHEWDYLTSFRLRGYQDALRDHGVAAPAAWIRELVRQHPDEFRGRGRAAMASWLEDSSSSGWNGINCTALICQNDRTAIGVLEALREAGVNVPGEMSVIGFDSTDECTLVTPPLTSIRVPLEEIGAEGVDLLVSILEDSGIEQDRSLVLPTQLEERGSVRRLNEL